MTKTMRGVVLAGALLSSQLLFAGAHSAETLTGTSAYGDFRADSPGLRRHLSADGLPAPFDTRSASNTPSVVEQPAGVTLHVPPGFTVTRFAEGLTNPRAMRVSPNGDVLVAETGAGRIRLLQTRAGAAQPTASVVFASGLDRPFGMAFYPPGGEPRWLYVAENNRVVRFAYQSGDLHAREPAAVIVARLSSTSGYHTTRDIAFSADGERMWVSVGSGSNVGALMGGGERPAALGAAYGREERRADVLQFNPDGSQARLYATGLRNCVGLAVQPGTGIPWCATNERDGLGDNLPPDYVTRVAAGAFYGWPWYYISDHEDPRRRGERPDLAGHVTAPDVLLQPHSAPLGIAFYDGAAFPPEYRGDAFVALHGSWNRSLRTGYKVVRILLRDGVPTGEYEDFLTGFVLDADAVWGRPVGVAVAQDGALLVSEDGNGTVWRIAYQGK